MEDPMAFINEVSNPDVLEQAISMYIRSKRRQSQDDTVVRGGSRPGKRPNINRQREFYARLLHQDYWGPLPIYDTEHFRRNFKLPIDLFDKIMADITNHDEYFQLRLQLSASCGCGTAYLPLPDKKKR
ncbi:hypothetical protein H257_14538 [Aphanomyces astaci]|uniref:Uncharacterized protein n=1 Tax=Aphanomyces astaci TaxID=112090 RepID=W4FSM7_APHAT|nr:hypothetical protein H257_14538 [Aphanomyces astaci]ETV69951.1 hypothetical protein H257_14538 [Aphanomyces astaci]|eukprot:XP_009840689.1 hypothetical protein H257_14538 [Aphanomyces astaci]